MTKLEMFRKDGARYSPVPFYRTVNPSEVFHQLSAALTARYVLAPSRRSSAKVTRSRCPYCDSFDEITVIDTFPNSDRIKSVFTVPAI